MLLVGLACAFALPSPLAFALAFGLALPGPEADPPPPSSPPPLPSGFLGGLSADVVLVAVAVVALAVRV